MNWSNVELKKLPAAQDSNPGSLRREYQALPVSHCALQYSTCFRVSQQAFSCYITFRENTIHYDGIPCSGGFRGGIKVQIIKESICPVLTGATVTTSEVSY